MQTLLLTALAPIIWGSTYLIIGLYLPENSPLWVAVFRALPTGLLLMLLFPIKLSRLWLGRMIILGIVNIGVFFGLLFVAAYRLPGGVAATLLATLPLFLLVALWIFKGKRPSWQSLLAAVFGVIGVAVLVLQPAATVDAIGVLAALGATLAIMAGTLLFKEWGTPFPILGIIAWQLVVGGLFLLPFALWQEGLPPVITQTNFLGLLWLGIFNTGLGYFLWLRGLTKLPAEQLGFMALLSPASAILLGVLVMHEHLTAWQWAALLVIVLSLVSMQRKPARV